MTDKLSRFKAARMGKILSQKDTSFMATHLIRYLLKVSNVSSMIDIINSYSITKYYKSINLDSYHIYDIYLRLSYFEVEEIMYTYLPGVLVSYVHSTLLSDSF